MSEKLTTEELEFTLGFVAALRVLTRYDSFGIVLDQIGDIEKFIEHNTKQERRN